MVQLDLENGIIAVVVLIALFFVFDSVLGSIISFFFSVVSLAFSFILFVTIVGIIAATVVFAYGVYALHGKITDSSDETGVENGAESMNNTVDTVEGGGVTGERSIDELKEKYASGELSDAEFEREIEKEL